MLVGPGYSCLFAILLLFTGSLTDKVNRKWMLSLSCLCWSITTYMHSHAHNIEQLIGMRAVLGGFHAFFGPAAFSMVADFFPKEKRARAFFIYNILCQLGESISAMTINLVVLVGWRAAY